MSLDTREQSRHGGNPVECYRIQSGSTVWRYTSADLRLSFDAGGEGVQTYAPEPIARGELTFSEEDGDGGVDVQVPRWNPVAQLFVPFTPPSPVSLKIYRLHPDDGEVIVAFTGRIVRASFSGSDATLGCLPLSADLLRSIPRIACSVRCSWALYSPGCGLNPANFEETGSVTSVSGLNVTAAVFATQPDNYFALGYLELADGTRRYITAHTGDTVTLEAPIIGLAASTAFSAFPGCDLLETTCVSKFNNLANHMGFKRLPTRNPYRLGMV